MMNNLINKFPNDLEKSLIIAKEFTFKSNYSDIQNIIICGLGGSGIGGKMVEKWFQNELQVPLVICQDYQLPAFVNQNTLLIASSYSGNTEETLSAVEQGITKGAQIVAVSSGGRLSQICSKHNFDCVIVPGGNPPRTQLAHSLVQITNIFIQLGLVSENHLKSFEKGMSLLISQLEEIQAKGRAIADFSHGKFLITYAQAQLEPVALRAKQQFNENTKLLAYHNVIPEMNHNELVGWAGGSDNFAVLFIRTPFEHPQNEKRFAFSKQRIQKITPHTMDLFCDEKDIIVNSLYLIHVIDWASLFLAEKLGVDPIEIDIIDSLKESLTINVIKN
ncbi:MAG: bifunctional phosphoglucose/phosphomannose isomerase [Crocinitomicaceae bacterium]|nr:bifunctional phosphoglucose/phosphomannose isomerase [Crocinitomicaceae bacterium]